MERRHIIALLTGIALAATGCGDDNGGSGATGGTGGTGGAGGNPGTPALEPLPESPSFAVVSSDFSETSIAVLDDEFGILDESWINSGTTFPGLVATLSGDVVLPTLQAGDGTFSIVDRFQTDVVSQFFVPSGNINGQVRTQGTDPADFASNPHDWIFVDATSAWATRFGTNTDPAADPVNQGTDLLEIDPSTMTLTGERIDLSVLNTTGIAMGDDGPVEVEVFARPSRGVRIGTTLVVGLTRLSENFDAAGPGMAAIVDVVSRSVEGLPLGEGLANCGRVVPVPGAPTKVVVSCSGFSQPFGDEAQTRASAGVALVEVDAGVATIETTWRSSSEPSSAIAVQNLVALDESRVVAVDYTTGTADGLYLMNIETGDQELLYESSETFQVGSSAYDPANDKLYVPDADPVTNAVIEFDVAPTTATEVGSISIEPSAFPPRAVYLLN